jgi:purine-nucleoside phosphorylase
MSTVPEAIAAHALSAEVLAISLVTNLAAGLVEGGVSHEEVMSVGEAAAPRCADLLAGILDRLG